MFGCIKKLFFRLLSIWATGTFDSLLATNYKEPIKCVYLNNPPCQTRPTIVNINSGETLFIHLLLSLTSVVEVVTSVVQVDDP